MPSVALNRKLDILSRSTTTPKILMDVLYLIVGELDCRDTAHRSLEKHVDEIEQTVKDPTHELQRDIGALRSNMDALRFEAQQLEQTIREAEASFSAQYEVKRAQLEETLSQLSWESERLLRDEIPSSVSAHLKHVTTTIKDISNAALTVASNTLKDLKTEVVAEVEEATKHQCTTALDQLNEECQVVVFSSVKRLEGDLAKSREQWNAISMDAVREIHRQTSLCATFLGDKVAQVLHYEPLLESHRLLSEVQYCHAQVQWLKDTVPSALEVAGLKRRVEGLEQDGSGENSPSPQQQKMLRQVAGFVSLWDADLDVLEEMSALYGVTAEGKPTRVAQMKATYLHTLPAFRGLVPRAATGSGSEATPPPKEMLLQEVKSVCKSAPGADPRFGSLSLNASVLGGDASRNTSPRSSSHRQPAVERRERTPQHMNRQPFDRSFGTPAPPPLDLSTADSIADVFTVLFHGTTEPRSRSTPPPVATPSPSVQHHPAHATRTTTAVASGKETASTVSPSEPLGLVVCDGDPLSGGVIVTEVVPASRIERTGVIADDQVLSVNGAMIANRRHLGEVLQGVPLGDPLRIHIYRPGTAKMFVVQTTR